MATKPPTSYALLIHFKTLNKPTKNRRPSRRASKSRCQVDQLSHDMLLFCFGPKKAREKRRFHAEFYMKSGCHRDKPWGSNKKYLESGAPIFFGWSCERSDFFKGFSSLYSCYMSNKLFKNINNLFLEKYAFINDFHTASGK